MDLQLNAKLIEVIKTVELIDNDILKQKLKDAHKRGETVISAEDFYKLFGEMY